MQTAQQPECICRSRYRFGWVWDGMASTEPLQARTSCQPRLLRIRANLNPRSAKCLLRTGLAHCYTHAYIKAILKGKLPRRKKATTPSVVLQSVSPSVARAGSRSSVPPPKMLREDGASATAAAATAPAQGFVETFRVPVAGAAATKLPAGGTPTCARSRI